jgi:hypothetical protein
MVPFGHDEIDRTMSEAQVVQLSRLRHLDYGSFVSALIMARADARRAQVAAATDAASRDRMVRRTIERTAPGLTAEDFADLHKVMTERRCSGIEAAAIVGAQRAAAKAEQS